MSQTAFGPLKKYSVKVILAPLFKLFECVCELFVPILVKQIIDYLSANDASSYDWQEILRPSLIMLALALLGFGVTMITQYLAARVSADYSYGLKKELYRQINALSDEQIDQFGRSKVLTLVNNDSFSLQTGVNMFMRLLARSPFLLIGSVVASFVLSPMAGFIVLGVLLASSFVVFLVMALTPKRYAAIQSELDHISTLGEDALSGARPIRAFNKQEYEIEKFKKASSSYQRKTLSLAKVNAWLNPMTFALINLGVILVLFLSGNRDMGAGTAVAVVNYLTQALTALIMFSRLVLSLAKAMASKKRVDAFLKIEPTIVSGKRKEATIEAGKPIFELKNVSLSYGGEEAALKNVDFQIKEGERIGIIGGTGSGKSSLLALLERFYDASEGEVLYCGRPIQEYDLGAYRKQIALVSQKPQLYKGSIRSNILLGNPSAKEEDIEMALKDSLAYEFVSQYEDEIDHEVEEGGTNFSGGQKQRLLLCRALLSKRRILILDDATSALDYKSDLLVRENIAKRNGTLLMVSQRATSIKNCDRIYVMEAGKIAAVGTHDTLLKECTIYREIYESQVAVR